MRLLPAFTSPLVLFVNTAFIHLLTEPLPSARYGEGYEDKSEKCTFQKTEGERSNAEAESRVEMSKCPKQSVARCSGRRLVLGEEGMWGGSRVLFEPGG